jgi:uncharacterized membrane protein YhaH (DUF805 family)
MIDWQSMTPIDWALRPLKRYADFTGRSPRAEYWWFVLGSAVGGFVAAFLGRWIGQPIFFGYGPLRLVLITALLLPTYSVTVRRLHDSDNSGWWVLARLASAPFQFAPKLHLDRSMFDHMSGWFIAGFVVLALGWACAEITLIVFLFIKGTDGSNRYGPDPYGGQEELEQVFA